MSRRRKRRWKRAKGAGVFVATVVAQRAFILALAAGVAFYIGRNSATDLAISAAALTLSAARYCLE